MAKTKPTINDPQVQTPIGVPQGYTVQRPTGVAPFPSEFSYLTEETTYQQGPRYFVGDELSPAGAPIDQIIDLQNTLEALGLLGAHTVGLWDDASASAYADALAIANRMGMTFEELAASGAVSSKARGGGGGGVAAPKLPNPEDVKALLNDSAYKLIGRNLDQSQLDAGVNAFYNSYQNTGGYQSADPSTIAEGYLRGTQPEQVQAHQAANVYGVFEKMLGGL